MKVFLNARAVLQLEELMRRADHTSYQHCLQVLLTTVTNNLRKADAKKKLHSI